MKFRRATYLIRALLLVVCFQFTAPLVVASPIEKNFSDSSLASQKHASKPITLSSLFEKTEKEGEEERTKFEAEAHNDIALNYLVQVVLFNKAQVSNISSHLYKQPLFALYCIYLI